MRRLWPDGLAGRLVVLLVTALAAAQAVFVLVLYDEQRAVVETMAHGQALDQVVALSRLLTTHPAEEAGRLTAAFGSRMTCARVLTAAEPGVAASGNDVEQRLTDALRRRLHGDYAGAATVRLTRTTTAADPCGGSGDVDRRRFADTPDETPKRPERAYSAEMTVPLRDGRIVVLTSVIETPRIPKWVATLSFLFSAIAVGAVVVVSVRHQTRSLRVLADAAERMGRGEEIPPLTARGPTEIALAISAFDTMRDRLRRYMNDRLKLLAAVSHDLRTPLTTLRLKAEFVDDEAVRDDLVTTIDELTAITDETLAFSQAEASREATEELDLGELVAEVAQEFHLKGGDVTIDLPEDGRSLRSTGRPISLKRAIRNLIENALRYGRRARIAIASDAAGVTLRIDDDGPGISEARMEDAFEPFVRLEPSRSRETGGIGLGLSITRGIVQGHGGTIRLVNRPGGGLTAEMSLPRAGR